MLPAGTTCDPLLDVTEEMLGDEVLAAGVVEIAGEPDGESDIVVGLPN